LFDSDEFTLPNYLTLVQAYSGGIVVRMNLINYNFQSTHMRTTHLYFTICIALLSAAIFSGCDDTEKAPLPVIESFTPTSDGVDVEVIIKGKNFGTTISHAEVDFNGTIAVIADLKDTLITTHVPVGATTGKIKFTIDGRSALSLDDFVVLSGRWEQKASMPGDYRFFSTGFSIGNKGYVCGGVYPPVTLGDLYEYDSDLDQWTQKASIPGERQFSAGFVVGGKAYVGLGKGTYEEGELGDFYKYDPSTDEWTAIATFPGGAREAATGFSIGTKGYVCLGYNWLSDVKYYDLWEYDPSTDAWTQMADFPGKNGSEMAIGLTIDGKAYVGLSYYKDWWRYDPVENSWTSLAPFGDSYLSENTAFTSNGKIYVFPGYYNECWEYDPSLDKWQKQTSTPMAVVGNCSFTIGDDAYSVFPEFPYHNRLWKFSAN
jgi:N-acetylneuraminic acid mutarotase